MSGPCPGVWRCRALLVWVLCAPLVLAGCPRSTPAEKPGAASTETPAAAKSDAKAPGAAGTEPKAPPAEGKEGREKANESPTVKLKPEQVRQWDNEHLDPKIAHQLPLVAVIKLQIRRRAEVELDLVTRHVPRKVNQRRHRWPKQWQGCEQNERHGGRAPFPPRRQAALHILPLDGAGTPRVQARMPACRHCLKRFTSSDVCHRIPGPRQIEPRPSESPLPERPNPIQRAGRIIGMRPSPRESLKIQGGE